LYCCSTIFAHNPRHSCSMYHIMGPPSLSPVDISPCPVLPPPRHNCSYLAICGCQDFASALKTRQSPHTVTVSEGSLVVKLHGTGLTHFLADRHTYKLQNVNALVSPYYCVHTARLHWYETLNMGFIRIVSCHIRRHRTCSVCSYLQAVTLVCRLLYSNCISGHFLSRSPVLIQELWKR